MLTRPDIILDRSKVRTVVECQVCHAVIHELGPNDRVSTGGQHIRGVCQKCGESWSIRVMIGSER